MVLTETTVTSRYLRLLAVRKSCIVRNLSKISIVVHPEMDWGIVSIGSEKVDVGKRRTTTVLKLGFNKNTTCSLCSQKNNLTE